ncbi:uncharacterized protein LOC113208653 [Frankliniella occidentalis]|uniref:Uncharacterized protein LOC113208653 n=1 Tax=Frankliniella occidentalis TaxID=133901 RepID=A0A6J1SJT8_FRAOC|nr:uncharacterized protein LOC113208653 [Frankliniella occidentalis]
MVSGLVPWRLWGSVVCHQRPRMDVVRELEARLSAFLEEVKECKEKRGKKRRRRVPRWEKRAKVEELNLWTPPPPLLSPLPASPETVPYRLIALERQYIARGLKRSNEEDPRGWLPVPLPPCLSPLPPSPRSEPEDQFIRKQGRTKM